MRSSSFLSIVLVAALGAVSANAQQSLAQFQGQVLAFTPNGATPFLGGDVAPGCGGDIFGSSTFDNSVIDGSGNALFRAKLVSAAGGVLSPTYLQFAYFVGDSRANLVKVVRGGDPEPSGTVPNAILSTSTMGNALNGSPRISDNGTILFGATIWDFVGSTITASNDTVLYIGTPGNFAILAREGDVAPGTGGATYSQAFSGVSYQNTCVNAAGYVLFQSSLLTGSGTPPVTSSTNAAWFGGVNGNIEVLLRKGEVLPSGEQINTSSLGFLSQMNASGQCLLDVTYVQGTGTPAVTAANDRAIWICTPTGAGVTRQVLAREGDPTPIAGTFFGTPTNSWTYNTGASTFNASGDFLDRAPLIGAVTTNVNDQALMILKLSGHVVVFQRGDLAPGVQIASPGAALDLPSDTSLGLNDSGRVCFAATMVGGGVVTTNDTGVWTGSAGNLALVAREGDVAPGTGGLTFGNMTGMSQHINGAGQILFSNTLSNGFGSLWSWDPVLGLQCVVRNGDSIEVQPGVFRTAVGSTGGVQFTNGDGRSLMLANDGTTNFNVSMTDSAGTSSVFASMAKVSVRIGSLTGLPGKISEAAGGTHNLYLKAGAANAGYIYVVAGSASGTVPGTPIGAFIVPLNIDPYTDFTLMNANMGPFLNTFSTLNTEGRAVAQIVIPPALSGIAGIVVHHAYGVLDPFSNLVFASEAARLEIIP